MGLLGFLSPFVSELELILWYVCGCSFPSPSRLGCGSFRAGALMRLYSGVRFGDLVMCCDCFFFWRLLSVGWVVFFPIIPRSFRDLSRVRSRLANVRDVTRSGRLGLV